MLFLVDSAYAIYYYLGAILIFSGLLLVLLYSRKKRIIVVLCAIIFIATAIIKIDNEEKENRKYNTQDPIVTLEKLGISDQKENIMQYKNSTFLLTVESIFCNDKSSSLSCLIYTSSYDMLLDILLKKAKSSFSETAHDVSSLWGVEAYILNKEVYCARYPNCFIYLSFNLEDKEIGIANLKEYFDLLYL